MEALLVIRKCALVTLLATFFVACKPVEQKTVLSFNPVVNNDVLRCNSEYGSENQRWQLSQLQFFVSNIRLVHGESEQRMSVIAEADHSNEVALVGIDCEANNDENGQEQGNWRIPLDATDTAFDVNNAESIRFDIGVPFHLNHSNPLTADFPLNQSDMFWTWQMGHKFFRLDTLSGDGGWAFHLGSTGCKSPSVMRAPDNVCRFPNRVSVELPVKDSHEVLVDIGALIDGLGLNGDNRCMSGKEQQGCKVVMPRLGVDSQSEVFKAMP